MHLLGLDIGGSKTHAISRQPGAGNREIFTGTANLASVGEAEAGRQLDSIFAQLVERRPGQPVSAICAGAAGVDTPETEARLRTLISTRAPQARLRIVHDTHLILAAAGLDTGLVVISGTGSAAYGRDATGRSTRAGGWGYLLGDEGSGYTIARAAVRHALRRADQGLTADRLAEELAADCGRPLPGQLLDHFYAAPERRYWAERARVVFALADDGDPAAMTMITAAAHELAELVRTVAIALGSVPGPVVLAGGVLVHQPRLQGALAEALAVDGLVDLRVLDRAPVIGAIRLAEQLVMTPRDPTSKGDFHDHE